MAKGEHVVALARAALERDHSQVVNVCQCIMASESPSSSLRGRINRLLQRTVQRVESIQLPADIRGLVSLSCPDMSLQDIELPPDVGEELGRFLEEMRFRNEIHSHGLSVASKICLIGPPGNGKTSLAGGIAKELELPFYTVDLSAIVSSLMGETGSKLAKVFRGVSQSPCVLFLDEMETLLTERSTGDRDVGEIKRVVSTLLLEIDRLPDHVVLIGATNHEEMLDRAVLRRFDVNWKLPLPTAEMIAAWLERFSKRYPDIPILSAISGLPGVGASFSDMEKSALKWCRQWIVSQAKVGLVSESCLVS